MEKRPCSSRQTRPAAAKLPGTARLFGQSKPLISSVVYRMIYSFFFFFLASLRNDASLGNGKQNPFFSLPAAFSRPSGQHIAPFHTT